MDKESLELEIAKRKNKRLVTKNTKLGLEITRLKALIDDIAKAEIQFAGNVSDGLRAAIERAKLVREES